MDVIYDLVGVGVGPFNLSLATLMKPINELKTIFFEQNSQFNWHPGLLLDNATLQVPYLADMVTFADPTSHYSFLNYLKQHKRLYKFYFHENFFVLRQEYNHYCQWVSKELENLYFNTQVVQVDLEPANPPLYKVTVKNVHTHEISTVYTRHIALGVGTVANYPNSLPKLPNIFHTADFLARKSSLENAHSICVVGSGQSAAEIILNLLSENYVDGRKIYWLTRSKGFFPMEYSKFGLEHFSPDYMNLFYSLDKVKRTCLVSTQDMLYKGISKQTIADIFDLLYQHTIANKLQPLTMLSNTNIDAVKADDIGNLSLKCRNNLTNAMVNLNCSNLILGTGYKAASMEFLNRLKPILVMDTHNHYALNKDFSIKTSQDKLGKIFMQNNTLLSHGVGSPDLGLACYRNSVIINSILGYDFYPLDKQNVFQDFNYLGTEYEIN